MKLESDDHDILVFVTMSALYLDNAKYLSLWHEDCGTCIDWFSTEFNFESTLWLDNVYS